MLSWAAAQMILAGLLFSCRVHANYTLRSSDRVARVFANEQIKPKLLKKKGGSRVKGGSRYINSERAAQEAVHHPSV